MAIVDSSSYSRPEFFFFLKWLPLEESTIY